MKTTNTKIILVIVFCLAILICIFAIWKFRSPTKTIIVTPSVNQTALSPLQADLQTVTPHFIDASKANAQTLTTEEQKIKDDVIAVLVAGQPDNKDYYSGLWLDAVGKRYILISQPSAESSINEVIDSQTGKTTLIPGGIIYPLSSERGDIALYIDTQAIRTYTLDQADAVLVSGSQLSGNETYHSGEGDSILIAHENHTEHSITIAVYDSSQIVQNPDTLSQPTALQTMNKKVREVTLSF